MKKEIRDVKDGIVRITTVDERWYARSISDPVTHLPTYQFVPSVTWIAEHYPKGIGFYKWLANTGWDESQALKEAAGDKGSKVHAAIVVLLEGGTVKMEDSFVNPSTGQPETLTLEEYQAILSFAAWVRDAKPVTVMQDVVVWNDVDGYAGTVDYVCQLDGVLTVVDFKTSKAVWPSHRMQVSAYKHAHPAWTEAKLMILQLGYERNRLGYKPTEIEDCYPLFLHTKGIWAEETKGQHPSQKDYPMQIALPAITPTPTTAPASLSHGTEVPLTGGQDDGGVSRLGEKEQQDAHSGGRGNRGSGIRRVQNHRKPV